MAGLPHIVVNDFLGVQANFEGLSTQLNNVVIGQSSALSDISALQNSLGALSQTINGKVDSVSASGGIAKTGSTIVSLTVDPATTASGAVPSASSRMQISGYRSITTSGSTLTLTDYYVEVASTATSVTSINLPAYNATGQFAGKTYLIRNGLLTKTITVTGVVGVAKAASSTAKIGPGTTVVVINTGAKWRSLGDFRTGQTIGGVS